MICVLPAIAVSVTLERIVTPEQSEKINNEQAPVSQDTSGGAQNSDDPLEQRQEKSMACPVDDANANMVRVATFTLHLEIIS